MAFFCNSVPVGISEETIPQVLQYYFYDSIGIPITTPVDVSVLQACINLFVSITGGQYGQQYYPGIEFDQIVNFVTDYYGLRYLSRQVGVPARQITKTMVAVSNLLRNCTMYNINEVFLGTLRLKKAKDANAWVIVEW